MEMKSVAEEESRLATTFSKRKSQLLKQASEMSSLYGAEVGLLLSSPTSGEPFAFGTPSIEEVAHRFLKEKKVEEEDQHKLLKLQNLNNRYNELLVKVRAAKEKNDSLKKITEAVNTENAGRPEWWDVDVDSINSHAQANRLDARMDRFYRLLCNYMENNQTENAP